MNTMDTIGTMGTYGHLRYIAMNIMQVFMLTEHYSWLLNGGLTKISKYRQNAVSLCENQTDLLLTVA